MHFNRENGETLQKWANGLMFCPRLTQGYTQGQINRIHHGWSVEIGKSQPEGPSVPVGNEARRVSHWNDGPEG